MALVNLLEMSETEMVDLRPFVRGNSLYVASHTAWNIFFEKAHFSFEKGDSLVQKFIDSKLHQAAKQAEKLDTYQDAEFSLRGNEENSGFNRERINYLHRKQQKSNIYLNAILQFIEAYENLRQLAFLQYIMENEMPCLFLLPKDFPESAKYSYHYSRYLNDIVGYHKVPFLETEEKDSGEIQEPPLEIIYKLNLQRECFLDARKLDKFDELCSILGIEHIDLFGGNINQCLYSSEASLKFSKVGNIRVLTDVSTSFFLFATRALLYNMPKEIVNGIGEEKYSHLVELVNRLLRKPSDLRILKNAMGKNPREQLSLLESFSDITKIVRGIKEIYSFKHGNVVYSGYRLNSML